MADKGYILRINDLDFNLRLRIKNKSLAGVYSAYPDKFYNAVSHAIAEAMGECLVSAENERQIDGLEKRAALMSTEKDGKLPS